MTSGVVDTSPIAARALNSAAAIPETFPTKSGSENGNFFNGIASRLRFVTPSRWLAEEVRRSPILGKYRFVSFCTDSTSRNLRREIGRLRACLGFREVRGCCCSWRRNWQ